MKNGVSRVFIKQKKLESEEVDLDSSSKGAQRFRFCLPKWSLDPLVLEAEDIDEVVSDFGVFLFRLVQAEGANQ